MTAAVPFAEIWRGDLLESVHLGHAVICDETGQVVNAWGDPDRVIYPRSSAKMIQALPLVTSGAADAFGLTPEQLALACASHTGARIHTDRVQRWLGDLGLDDHALRCGSQEPSDRPAMTEMIKTDQSPCQIHNNCSGKHSGFLTLSRHLKAGPEYIEIDHPVQKAVLGAFQDVTGESGEIWGVDGCSAPNFACSLTGFARAMSWYATAHLRDDPASRAARRLVEAMMAHPELVAGEDKCCTHLMRALAGKGAVKTGAEGVYIAILPEKRLGVALKIADGTTRASECAIATLLVKLGVLDAEDPAVSAVRTPEILSRAGLAAGAIRPGSALQ